jgi:type 1 glutamine amidotransferase
MAMHRLSLALLIGFALTVSAPSQPKKKKILAIGQVKGFQHDSVSHALATIERMGRESGVYDTYIRTDTQLLTKQKIEAGNAKNLNYFDAVIFYTTGELDMDDQQKKDLLSFVHEDGKGFVGIHSAIDTFYKWPEYGEMIGGYFNQHPWGVFDAPMVVQDANFPGMNLFPKTFTFTDEIYQVKNFNPDVTHVIVRMDASKLDLTNKNVSEERRADKNYPVSWAKMYGKGRVYYSTLGHREESWDRKDVQSMYMGAIKWALGLVDADITPNPK